jgi:hypothetical protein
MCRRRLGGSWLARVIRSRSGGEDSQLIVSGGEVVENNVQEAVGGQLVGEGDQVPVHGGAGAHRRLQYLSVPATRQYHQAAGMRTSSLCLKATDSI